MFWDWGVDRAWFREEVMSILVVVLILFYLFSNEKQSVQSDESLDEL